VTFVRTVLGDIDPADLGVTYAHEHVVIDGGRPVLMYPDFDLSDVDAMTTEIREAAALGLRAVVDAIVEGGPNRQLDQRAVDLRSLLLADYFRDAVAGAQDAWRRVVTVATEQGVAIPAFSSSLSYYDGYRRERGPANATVWPLSARATMRASSRSKYAWLTCPTSASSFARM